MATFSGRPNIGLGSHEEVTKRLSPSELRYRPGRPDLARCFISGDLIVCGECQVAMNKKPLLMMVLCASTLRAGELQVHTTDAANSPDTKAVTGFGLLASKMGAALNANLFTGGGTDDTSALQAILNRAEHGAPVHLVIDGAALISGLQVYGNTIIECINGGGFYLKNGSSRSIIRNAHRSRDAIHDERITVRGCFLNGNRWNQPSALLPGTNVPSNKEADGTFLTGLQFLGVNDLIIENVTLWNIRAFGALIGNANRVDIRSVIVDYGAAPGDTRNYGNTDGLHFTGPLRYVTIDGVKIRTADDALAFNANDYEIDDLTIRNDFGPYVRQGPITDVTVNNVQLMDTVWGIRLLSTKERIDRVTINNVTGTVRGAYVVNISHFVNPTSLGNFGTISISNVDVDRSGPTQWLAEQIKGWVTDYPEVYRELNGGVLPFISVNSRVESLALQNIETKVTDARPILRVGPDATVKMATFDLRIYDPELQANPVELDNGSRIESLNLSIFWKSAMMDQGKQPITYLGGAIGQLHWINSPPMYVNAHLSKSNVLTVTFNEDVKAADFAAGVTIKVNDKSVRVPTTVRQRDAKVVRYVLKEPIRTSDNVTWSYNAAEGTIQNFSGDQLFSVSEKKANVSTLEGKIP